MPQNKRLFALIFVFSLIFLVGCSKTAVTSEPTFTASPEATATPTPLAQPQDGPMPVTAEIQQKTPIVLEQPTVAPSPSEPVESFLGQEFPAATLNIYSPGPNSKISSPINLKAFAFPGDHGKITLQLFGEDGRLMADQLIQLSVPDSGWVSFSSRVPFEINSGAESSLLTLTTFDEYGRRIALNSLPLLLIQVGDSEIEVPTFQDEPIVISKPAANAAVKSGVLHVEGFLHPYSDSPLIVELIKPNGAIVASRQVIHKMLPQGEDYVSFSFDLEYSVAEQTPVRLTIRQIMDKTPFLDVALSSQVIQLQP